MQFTLFTLDGLLFLLRWFHFFFGILWIGHLYYFNFTQGDFFAATDATTKSNAIQKLVPRALWWFRWGAMWTMATGLAIFAIQGHRSGHVIFLSSWGMTITTGMILGLLMWANVWFVIWPNQRIVIASATAAAAGGQADPKAAGAGARALCASRTNVLFSIPMLFFMGAAMHLPLAMNETPMYGAFFAALTVLLGALEYNALKGKPGPLATVKGVIHMGFGLTVVLYVLIEALI